jgi:antitoxin CptB
MAREDMAREDMAREDMAREDMAREDMARSVTNEGLDVRRRRVLFRAWHRGMREMDLIMGRFAESAIAQLTHEELAEFERLMEIPDRALLAWVTGEAAVCEEFDTPLFRRLRDFNRRGEGVR